MKGRVDDGEVDAAGGASRRSVLRGGAIGVGALVGAVAMVNANEVASEAQAGSSVRLFVGFAGINLTHTVPLDSFGLGGHDDNGTLATTLATLTLDSTKYSPKLLRAYAEQTNISSIVIRQFEANLNGEQTLYMEITLHAARIVGYHADAVTTQVPERFRDTLSVAFGGVTVHRLDGTTYTWTLPT